MPKAIKKCKVCGKDYEACRTFRSDGVFRWQDVACCREHGLQYLDKVLAERAKDDKRDRAELET